LIMHEKKSRISMDICEKYKTGISLWRDISDLNKLVSGVTMKRVWAIYVVTGQNSWHDCYQQLAWLLPKFINMKALKLTAYMYQRIKCDLGPETQGGSLALCLYHWAIHYFCILGMVAWLSDGQCQEKTNQSSKTSMLRVNRSSVHHSHQCCGSTYLAPPTGASGTEWGEVSRASSLESGRLVLPASQART
jgi:hypothetical protein